MTTTNRTKIIIDNKIPFIQGCLEPFFEVEYLSAADFRPETIQGATALVVRTTVKCDESLLEKSGVRLIATATIGFDHIDTLYCAKNGILWQNAPGCNAPSVAQYIATLFSWLRRTNQFDYREKTIGLVGYGNVGQQVGRLSRLLGMTVLAYDPLIDPASLSDPSVLCSLEQLQEEAEILSFHTPLTTPSNSAYPTLRMADISFFRRLQKQPLIINSARGGVIDEKALLKAFDNNLVCGAAIDCWENEPRINPELLTKGWITTPHIAGYSADGKYNGTLQTLNTIAQFFNLPTCPTPNPLPEVTDSLIDLALVSEQNQIEEAILRTYPFFTDEINDLQVNPSEFRSFRDHYRLRREPKGYRVKNYSSGNRSLLLALGFKLL